MAYVIVSACIDVRDRSCMQECPVDCIYEGDRKMYIHPEECIDCGACEAACPVEAIHHEDQIPDGESRHPGDNSEFFSTPLPGRSSALGAPGGAHALGRVGVDTHLVSTLSRPA
jgi:Fe-S-cluster-containing hydrogenase component 2